MKTEILARVKFQAKRLMCYGWARAQRTRWLSALLDADGEAVTKFIREVERDRDFLVAVRRAYRQHTGYRPLPTDFMVDPVGGGSMLYYVVALYAAARIARPDIVVETGGTPGKSSAFILRALERNAMGTLYTIDLPPAVKAEKPKPHQAHEVRSTSLGTGWCIPKWLQNRHQILMGNARTHLVPLLQRIGPVDFFVHDSDHSYEHMRWELEAALPYVKQNGLVWADDVMSNSAWNDFCAAHALKGLIIFSQAAVRVTPRPKY